MSRIAVGVVEPVEVFFDDLDAMGVVHNGRYGLLLERAFAAYWAREGWPFDPQADHFDEIFFVVREFSIRYRRPILGVGTVRVHFWIESIDVDTVEYRFRILSGDHSTVYAEGRRTGVKVDRRTLQRTPISAAVRDACAALLGTAEPAAS
jgi:acyl-CoA thioester hydrolase